MFLQYNADCQVYGPDKSLVELVDVFVKQEGHELSVTGSTLDMSIASKIMVEVEIPIVHNINVITTEKAGISCQDMVGSQVIMLTIVDHTKYRLSQATVI